jgi:hypothetical protein
MVHDLPPKSTARRKFCARVIVLHTQPSLGASAPNQRSVTTFFRV